MSDKTGIQWTNATWNPTTGCDRVSPGCDHCYALTLAARLKRMGSPRYQNDGDPRTSGPGFGVTTHQDALDQPLRWKRPRRIFVNSMSDLFHKDVPDDYIAQVFAVMVAARRHTFQVLTKRHARMKALLSSEQFPRLVQAHFTVDRHIPEDAIISDWPLPNVWLGVSAEDQHWANLRIPALCHTPAAVRFVSAEPLLGPISLPSLPLDDRPGHMPRAPHWLIIGGESGPGARPMDLGWARDLLEQCRDFGIAPFVKQMGSVLGAEWGAGSHGADWDAWPADLRVREFPAAAQAVPA